MAKLSEGNDDKIPVRNVPKLLLRIIRLMGPYKWLLVLGNILAFICVYADVKIIVYFREIIKRDDLNTVPVLTIILPLMLISILSRATGFMNVTVSSIASNRAINRVRVYFFEHLQTLSKRFYDEHKSGWLVARNSSDMGSLQDFMMFGMMMIVLIIGKFTFIIYNMVLVSPTLILVCFFFIPAGIFLIAWFRRNMIHLVEKYSSQNSHMIGYLAESIKGVRVVQAYDREDFNFNEYLNYNAENAELGLKIIKLAGLFIPAMDLLGIISISMVMVSGTYLIHNPEYILFGETITAIDLCTYVIYMNLLLVPIRFLSFLFNRAISAATSARRIFEVIDFNVEVEDPAEGDEVNPENIEGDIEFKDVTFAYGDESEKILDHVDLHIKAGETIALIGETGVGKTTMAHLIARFYDVSDGEICLDGINIKSFKQDVLHSHMGIVLQDGFLFSGSVLDNIRFRNPLLSKDEVIALCKTLGTHEIILKLPNEYETMVHEGGDEISIGQRQIISLSRALAADPRILILDEATSAIDTYTEQILDSALEKLVESRTTIIIAHRLSTIRKADRILVIGDGGIIEAGSHDELIEKKGHYVSLLEQHRKAQTIRA